MPRIITIGSLTADYQVELDGQNISMNIYYVQNIDRWVLNISNNRIGKSSFGIVMNTGADLLAASGHLGLQALVPVSMPEFNIEADIINFPKNVNLLYLTMEEYNQFKFGGIGALRSKWNVQ